MKIWGQITWYMLNAVCVTPWPEYFQIRGFLECMVKTGRKGKIDEFSA